LNADAAGIAGELQSLDAALAEAQRRLEQARQDEARKADKRVVAKLPELLCRM
jgi:hypothetical protein